MRTTLKLDDDVVPAAEVVDRRRVFQASGGHAFWPDDLSLLDERVAAVRHLAGHREVTDAYLLALAVHRRGRLATFDRNVRLASVPGARADHVAVVAPTGPFQRSILLPGDP